MKLIWFMDICNNDRGTNGGLKSQNPYLFHFHLITVNTKTLQGWFVNIDGFFPLSFCLVFFGFPQEKTHHFWTATPLIDLSHFKRVNFHRLPTSPYISYFMTFKSCSPFCIFLHYVLLHLKMWSIHGQNK